MTLFWVFVRLVLLLITLGVSSSSYLDSYLDESIGNDDSSDIEDEFDYSDGFNIYDHQPITSTTNNAPTTVPPTPAYSRNFYVESVTDKGRQVRVFLHTFDGNYRKARYFNPKSMRLVEENRTLVEDETVYGNHLIRNISHKEHTFVFYTKTDSAEELLTIVKVPAQNKLLTLPGFVASMSNGEDYTYQWMLPSSDEAIVKVTMIWCDTIHHDLRTCVEDLLGQKELEVNQTEFQMNMRNGYKGMALRVDTESSSTGIVLPACEHNVSQVGMLNDSPVMSANASHISIEWAMQYPEEGVVYGVAAYYVDVCAVSKCAIESSTQLVFVTEETTLKATIYGLAPATQYRITAKVRLGNGKLSAGRERVYATMEASAPPQLPYESSEYLDSTFDFTDSDLTTTNSPQIYVPSTSVDNIDFELFGDEDDADWDDYDFPQIITTTNGENDTVTSVPSSADSNSGQSLNESGIDLNGEPDENVNAITNSPEISVPSTSVDNIDFELFEGGDDADWEDCGFTQIITTTNGENDTVTSVPSSADSNSGQSLNESGIDLNGEPDGNFNAITNSPEISVPSTSVDNIDFEIFEDEEYADCDYDFPQIITTTNGENDTVTSVPSSADSNSGQSLNESGIDLGEHFNLTMTTTNNPATTVPSVAEFNYNFNVDLWGKSGYRAVQLFCNYDSRVETVGQQPFETFHLSESNYTHLIVMDNDEKIFICYPTHDAGSIDRNFTHIVVPAQNDLLTLPGFVASISASGEYVYRWVLPRSNQTVVKVSIIQCDKSDYLFICDTFNEHAELDVNQTEFRFNTSSDGYNGMVLRIDTESSSTGIVRPACKNDESEVGMLNDSPVMSADASEISIEWGMQCPEEGVVYGVVAFNVYYCPMRDDKCVEAEMKKTMWVMNETTLLKTVIGDLAPDMQYKIAGTVTLGNGKESARRERLYTTAEDVVVSLNY